ncbi:protein sickie isoform X2 [Bacillus rossius redtenbacheri]|uniref:protein sickie isoform X2 n=1 Tax=Bacillus rossius redtenbacheri TaxID=93214 RepID=UPI002FDEC1CE
MEASSSSRERVDSNSALSGGQSGSSSKCLPHSLRNKLAKGVSSLKPAKQSSGKKDKTKISPKVPRAFGCGGSRESKEEPETDDRPRRSVEPSKMKVRTSEEAEASSLPKQTKIGVAMRSDHQSHLKQRSTGPTGRSTSNVADASPRSSLTSSSMGSCGGSSIPKPTAAVKGTSKMVKDDRQVPSPVKIVPHRSAGVDGGGTRQSGGMISVALVSPMPNLMSDSNYPQHCRQVNRNAMMNANVQQKTDMNNEITKNSPRKIETTFDNLDKVITYEAQPVQSRETTFGEDDTIMNVKPMQPLLRGYTRVLGLSGSHIVPSGFHDRTRRCISHSKQLDYSFDGKRGVGDGGYRDPERDGEMMTGYMSDGDMLRTRTISDTCDGYLSEGGAPLYMQRFHNHPNNLDIRNSDLSSIAEGKGEFVTRRTTPRLKPRTRGDETKLGPSSTSAPGADSCGAENTHPSQLHKRLVQGSPGASERPGAAHKAQATFGPSEVPQVVYRVVGTRSQVKKADSSQQTDSAAYRQWKKHGEGGSGVRTSEAQRGKPELDVVKPRDKRGVGSISVASVGSNGQVRKPDKNTADRQKKMGVKDDAGGTCKEQSCGDKPPKSDRSSPHGSSVARSNGDGKSKVRGVPQSFGYVKRPTNGCGGGSSSGSKSELRTAQVSAVPRTKLKVSGGTQTCTTDLHHHHHYKSYSLTGPSASQLSQNVRDRLLLGSQSLLKPGPGGDYAGFYYRGQPRVMKPTDGSLSDTTYSNYADVQNYYANSSPYSSWLRHSATYTASLPTRASSGGLAEADSVESLCSLPAQLQHRASLTHARLLVHQRESSASPGPRLNRSSSIRSTKSEKMYPSMLQRSEEMDVYYGIPLHTMTVGHCNNQHTSQPTSPTPSQVSQNTAASRFNNPMSPITSSASTHGLSRAGYTTYSGMLSKANSKDDEVHGSSVSLVSTASSLYSTPEEKQAHEIRKLRRELQDAQEKVHTLTNQLSTNAHVVSAFEQSLSNMTQRLQHLTSTAERKDSELLELRQTIELLKKQSVEAGLTSAHIQSMSPSLARRHTINTSGTVTSDGSTNNGNMFRQLSADSVSSINSLSSVCSLTSTPQALDISSAYKKKKKGWLRSSFSKAFSRSKKNKNGSVSDVEDSRALNSDISAPSSPLLNNPHHINGPQIKGSQSSSAIYEKDANDTKKTDMVEELKKQLREKDLVLTDIRLEALSSAHQLESLKETVIKMRNEMLNLKQDNERLQRIVTSKSLTSSQSSLPHTDSLERRFSMTDNPMLPVSDSDGKRVMVSVLLGSHGSYQKYMEEKGYQSECMIASMSLGSKTKWDMLDCHIRRLFKEYVLHVDPASNLGLNAESIWSYHVGEVVRYKESPAPELLPCGYIVGDTQHIYICLKGAVHSGSLDALSFETLIPKSIAQRYISLLSEHRRIILCGPSGTGKSYLANKLAEFLVLRDGKESTAESIATFNVDHKSSKELRQYLTNVAEQCESSASDLPSVIILDNLHHAASLGEVFNGLLNAKYAKCPYIIGTMNQATCSTTNLQLHHNFRWVLCANHMEPVKGFLGRYLRRRLLESEVQHGSRSLDMARILDWIPRCWQHLNKFLETHSSSDVTIGPRLFLSCPNDPDGSQVWFTDLWNYSVVPYLMEAVREGLQLYGRRAQWEDPTQFIYQTYPWTNDAVHGGKEALLRLRPEDVGYDVQQCGGVGGSSTKTMSSTQSDTDGDPLLNMLMRLQEAANYSSPHSNDSDSISLDSHSSGGHLEEKVSSKVESTL